MAPTLLSADSTLNELLCQLQHGLSHYSLPETEDRTQRPRSNDRIEEVSMVVLGEPYRCLTLCLEGGRQCPGGLQLVFSSAWLHVEPPPYPGGLQTLTVHKAVTFDACGRTFLDSFCPPRRVTYLMDLTAIRHDRDIISKLDVNCTNLECPTGVSKQILRRLNDPLLMRILVADAGVSHPQTLAFSYTPNFPYNPVSQDISVIPVSDKEDRENIREHLEIFVSSLLKEGIRDVVVKGSGAADHKVSYHSTSCLEEVYTAVSSILDVLSDGDCVLVESFVETLKPTPFPKQNYEERTLGIQSKSLSCSIRVVVCSTPERKRLASSVVCGVGQSDIPLRCDNTLPQSLEDLLIQWGIRDKKEIERVLNLIKTKAEVIMEAWEKYESQLTIAERGGQTRTDVLGINFALTKCNDGQYDAVAVSINNVAEAIANSQLYESQNQNKLGRSIRPLVATMVNSSQRFLLHGKRILVIGGGEGLRKEFIWAAAKVYGVKIILVDPDPDHIAGGNVHRLIPCDISDHSRDDQNAEKIVNIVRTQNIAIDGCLAVTETYVPLTALVTKTLGMIGTTSQAAKKAKKKSLTQKTVMESTVHVPMFPKPAFYANKTQKLLDPAHVLGSSKLFQYPALLKLEYGSCAVGVHFVKDETECLEYFNSTQNNLKSSESNFGLGHGNAMFLTEYAVGTKHGVEIVMFEGKMVAAFLSDCGPTRIPNFLETTACMPSCYPKEKQKQLITAAYQCASAVGLSDGVFNVELKMTETGPKLIEVNGRMAEWYYRDWIRVIYDVDILLLNFLITCGIRPTVSPLSQSCQLMGVICTPTVHAEALSRPGISTPEILAQAHQRGEILYHQFEPVLETDLVYDKAFCQIAVKGESIEEAKSKLLTVCRKYGIDGPNFPMDLFLSEFEDLPVTC